MAVLEGKEILAEPWDQEIENGFRLKSTWIKIISLPLKLWHRSEFERLVEDFGMLLEIDRATEEKTSFLEAKIRVGVYVQSDIPPTGKAIFRNDRGDWCWKPVKFVVETPGRDRAGGIKRRRVWMRRPDQSGSDQGADNGGAENGNIEEGGDDEGYADEDLLQDEDRRNVRGHGGSEEVAENENVREESVHVNEQETGTQFTSIVSPVDNSQQLVVYQTSEVSGTQSSKSSPSDVSIERQKK